MKGLIIAGTHSGCGKTTIALGLMAALKQRGFSVSPFKVGPDFIDPGYHTRVTGIISRNLDGWMLSKEYNLDCFQKNTQGNNIAVVEGVMGLFDGYDGKSEAGSTAQMAKWLNLPVLLVVNAKSMARSAAALVRGFECFDKELSFAGVLFNHIGSQRHLSYLKEAISDNVTMTCLGGIIHDNSIIIPERHLGLVTQQDHPLTDDVIHTLANLIESQIDIDSLLENSAPLIPSPLGRGSYPPTINCASSVRIGVGMDNAFCFYYQDNLDMLKANGAELIYFSPITDNSLPENLDGIYLGGGYPELYAKQLAENLNMRNQIRDKSLTGMPIYGECGGFMYLSREICATDGISYPMVNCFPFTSTMFPRLKSLGYREITLTQDTIIGKKGDALRGHEFHYSEIIQRSQECKTVYDISDRTGQKKIPEGYQIAQTLGSYIHLHFGSRTDAAGHFVSSCLNYKKERIK